MTREESDKIVNEVIAWCEKNNISVFDNRGGATEAHGMPQIYAGDFNNDCDHHYRVGDRTRIDDYLGNTFNGYTAEEIENLILENWDKKRELVF